jgi:hypothetical protein
LPSCGNNVKFMTLRQIGETWVIRSISLVVKVFKLAVRLKQLPEIVTRLSTYEDIRLVELFLLIFRIIVHVQDVVVN